MMLCTNTMPSRVRLWSPSTLGIGSETRGDGMRGAFASCCT